MRIVFQHYEPLPVLKYGGTERILYWHMLELVRQGHQVTLIGHENCNLDNTGIDFIPYQDPHNWFHLIPKDSDILHLQYNSKPEIDLPVINTLHGNGKKNETFPINTVFVGNKHAKNHGAKAYVHNALDLKEYPVPSDFLNKRENQTSFLFLAKASWSVKNLKDCVRACKKSKVHLHIAGGKTLSLSSYIHNHGLIDNSKKLELFKETDALLFPVRWEEPFGIAMIEAMSQGIPIIGSKYGSLPEIVNSSNGILCNDYEEFFLAIKSFKKEHFDKGKIRKYVEDNFSIEQYSKKYLNYYNLVIGGESLNSHPPQWQLDKEAISLLPFHK